MLDSIYTAMSGLKGFSDALQTLSSDVSNMNTPGFKGSNVVFENAMQAQTDSSGQIPVVRERMVCRRLLLGLTCQQDRLRSRRTVWQRL